ncbi:MAG: Do family serine endopeptidase [Janthinobacterium lividum]
MRKFIYLGLLASMINPLQTQASDPLQPISKQQLQLSFAPVVKKVSPSVVNIYASRLVNPQTISPFLDDPFFKHFFGDGAPSSAPHARVQSSLGSGVLVRADGVVITNDHVIKQAKQIKVVLSDGREFEAEVIVRDVRTDLAALKLKTEDKNLPFLELRDADELQVGDIVLAVGNPFGFGQTVTMGIISGLARTEVGIKDFRSLIQTDAAVNPGNSGGPLITLDGRVVGINTAIFSNTGASIGISFAIPSNLVVPVLVGVDHGGKIIRPWVGISMQNVTYDIAQAVGLDHPHAIIVTKIYKNTPAERAGLREGDIILKIDGHPIVNESAYRFRVATAKSEKATQFTLWRNKSEQTISIALEVPPDTPNNKPIEISGRNPLSGALIMTLSPAVASDLGISYEETGGVVVIQVQPDTFSSQSGLLPGDIILGINNQLVENVDQLLKNLTRSRKGWEIKFKRGNKIFIQSW